MSEDVSRPTESVEDADWMHLTEGEQVRWVGRPSRLTIAPRLAFATLFAIAGVALTIWLVPTVDSAWLTNAPLLMTAIGAAVAGLTYLDWLRLLYVVTDEEIYVKYGLVSRDVTQVRLDRVQNTAYDQSIAERLLSYGTVRVYTAGTSTEDLVFENVSNPERVKGTLTELQSEQSKRRRQDAGGVR